jgi:copper transporter 1
MFAGSCIGAILLVILLEFLRRAGKEYDRHIVQQYLASHAPAAPVASSASSDNSKTPRTTTAPTAQKFRPSVLQQAIRALLHMFQFAVAYFIMLLAMYYNGYIIICIFIGAYLGELQRGSERQRSHAGERHSLLWLGSHRDGSWQNSLREVRTAQCRSCGTYL